jgi:hypothetical protein
MEKLREIKPASLFLACDGPRANHPEEASKVTETRLLAEEMIDWPCTVNKRYSDRNHGSKYGPGFAIDWFFSQVEEGIILEDDCLPHASFFPYCQTLLSRYRTDSRIWQISGNNFVESHTHTEASYSFTGYSTTWGWATWRRCWQAYDIEMSNWPQIRDSGVLVNAFESEEELDHWTKIWERLYAHHFPAAWDYQWNLTCFVNGGLSAIPRYNLVTNIGFGEGATHCFDPTDQRSSLAIRELSSIEHPRFVIRDWSLDRAIYENVYKTDGSANHGLFRTLSLRAYFTLQAILRKLGARVKNP